MTKEAVLERIMQHQPDVVYLTGKTCTGKTAFSNILQEHGYVAIALDDIVHAAVITPFGLAGHDGDVFISVYKNADQPEWVDAFLQEAHRRIANVVAQGRGVVIEGAVANMKVIDQLLADIQDIDMVYFHTLPESSNYERNLTSRLKHATLTDNNGLPKTFWSYIDADAFKNFCQNGVFSPTLLGGIKAYAEYAAQQSQQRLEKLQEHFSKLTVVEV